MAIGRKKRVVHTRARKRMSVSARRTLVVSCVCAFALFLTTLTWYGTRLDSFTVDSVNVTGAETVPPERIEERVNALLAGGYLFGLIPYRFSYALPSDYIETVVNEMPRISGSTVAKQGASLIVSVREYVPEMLWCGAATTSECYYVDPSGTAYEKAPDLTGEALMRFVVSGSEPALGASLLSDGVRATLLDIARAMEERHDFRVAKIEYAEDGDASLFLSGGGVVQISTQNDLEATYANLASILSSEDFAHLAPGNFERIDLRFGNKAFVQEEPYVGTSTASTTAEVE